jgi:hypothetical protein
MPTGEVRKLTTDPFERAAKREHQDEIRREMLKSRMWKRMRKRRDASGMGIVLVIVGLPYAVWALVRAAGFDFGEPTWGKSLIDYFFGGRFWVFGAYTGFMLLLIWVTAIVWVAERWD